MYNYQARNNPFAYRRPMTKKIPVTVTLVPAERVWAAAALADRVNAGAYHKEPQHDKDNFETILFEPNRTVMNRALTSNTEFTAEDLELGRLARAWHKSRLLMTAINGKIVYILRLNPIHLLKSLCFHTTEPRTGRIDFTFSRTMIIIYAPSPLTDHTEIKF